MPLIVDSVTVKVMLLVVPVLPSGSEAFAMVKDGTASSLWISAEPIAFSMVPPTAEVSATVNVSSSSLNASPLTSTMIEPPVAPWGS